MKVIHILHSLKYSGAEIMYVDAASVFQKLGCELNVVATAKEIGEFEPKFKKAGYRTYHKEYPSLKNYFKRIQFFIAFIKFLKQEKFQVLHNHSSQTYWGMAFCAKCAGIGSVHTFHNVFPIRWYSRPYHILLRWSAKKILKCRFQTISDSVYFNELNRFQNKTTKINNWYGNNRFYPAIDKEKEQIRNELGLPKDALILISVGGCSDIKRHSHIIKALPEITKSIPNTIYLHLGKGYTEDDENQLSQELNLDKQVLFCGNQDNVRKYLIASDIYLMPSKFEGISLTTIEAMACEIPAILYDVPGLKDFNKTGENSVIIPEDYHELAQAVITLFKNDNLKYTLKTNAKKYVDNNYNMETNASLVYQLYTK
jgi:glycosyltransferase involved in cell wall biosynthesis